MTLPFLVRPEPSAILSDDTILLSVPRATSVEDLERRYIDVVMQRCGGHRGQASAWLGISPKTLYRKLLHPELADRWPRRVQDNLHGGD